MTPVMLPEEACGETDEVSITNWFFDDGAAVSAGDLICEVMVMKVVLEVRAPTSGRLKILVPVDRVIGKGATLAEIH